MLHNETTVWEAFRALRLEGVPLYESLARHMLSSGFFETAGDTLEIGFGDGELWRLWGGGLRSRVTATGRLVLTDADSALVSASAEKWAGERVTLEHATATELPYSDGLFERVLAVHILHLCGGADDVRRAVVEVARVLNPTTGRALVVAVDETVHMAELYELMNRARDAVLSKGTAFAAEIPREAPRVQPFCSRNAPEYLSRAFRSVERIDCAYQHIVETLHPTLGWPAPEFIDAYVRTLPFVKREVFEGRLPEAFFTAVRAEVADVLTREGSLRWSRRDIIYDCSRPREGVAK